MFRELPVFVYCLCFVCFAEGLTKKVITKRSDIDLQTCIENFDVHKDKIIRTQDSKEMGAKYINEIDLGSREECLRLCCETDICDVFVFEEKNSGSCYLFQCGPPEDFKCKFTHHTNYSSAILAINRHLPDLESQIKLTKHEQDLTKLSFRKPEAEDDTGKKTIQEVKTTVSPTTTTEVKIVPLSPTKLPQETNKDVKCSRYQFECRSTKECIAIYNACDGIPQCADGSDEAPELGCPEVGTTLGPLKTHQNPAYEEIALAQNRPIVPQFANAAPQKVYQTPMQQRDQQNAQISNIQIQEADFVRPDSRNIYIPHPVPYDAPHPPAYGQIPAQPQANWITHQANQIPQQYPQYENRNSHIFNHKENGIQVSEGQDMSQTQFADVNGPANPKVVNYFDEVYRQSPQYQDKWAKGNREDRFNNRNQYVSEINQNPAENWPRQNVMQANEGEVMDNYNPPQANQDQNWKSEKHEEHVQEHEIMAHELKNSKQLMENVEKSTTDKQIKIEKMQKHLSQSHTQYSKLSDYKVAEVLDLQDGIAKTPGGAVLSLTLGLIITCIMALLIGCRLRVVRRRIRRGGKSYAHDADYLVNGMYL